MSGTVLTRAVSVLRAVRPAQPAQRGDWLSRLIGMRRAVRTRRELAALDDRQLRDIGLTREAAMEEAMRAPWDLVARQRDSGWVLR